MKVLRNKSVLANRLLGGVILLSVLFSACERKHVYVSPGGDKVTLENYYDFGTTKAVQLDVKYATDSKVYFEVYGENPLRVEDGTIVKDSVLIALAKGVTDENGKYNLQATLPASVDEVYIYSPDFGAPTLFKTQLSNGMIRAEIDFEGAIDLSKLVNTEALALATRAGWNFIEKYIPNRLSNWNVISGTPSALYDEPRINVDRMMKKYINTYLPEGGRNQSYAPYVTDNADITLYEEASKVTLSYLGGETSAKSVLAYYCYPKDATLDEIKKAAKNACVVFPNAHGTALGYYSGVTMKLKYIDPQGNMTDGNFPKDTKIGFMLWNNGWLSKPFNSNYVFYSTKALNNRNISCTATLGIKDLEGTEYNVISFEDWPVSLDYNDVVFVISSDPAESIVVPPAPDPTPETYTETYQGLLGFEDCWPSQGDYDMNDVVVKYFSNVTCNENNEIVSIIDKFTLVWSGANLRNGFGYQLPYNMDGKTVKFSGKGSISGNVVTLFEDAKQELGVENIPGQDMPSAQPQDVSYIITTTFDVPQSKEGIVPPYNPFITVNKSNTEVHLTNYKPTEEANNVFRQEQIFLTE